MAEREWIFCQIGAREHYALPAELHRRGLLRALCTDIWASPNSIGQLASSLGRGRLQRLRDRYTQTLADALVLCEPPVSLLLDAAKLKLSFSQTVFERTMHVNRRFAMGMAERLKRGTLLEPRGGRSPVVFAYSYGALEILRAAKEWGCLTVLGQIDPGPEEERLVVEASVKHGLLSARDNRWPKQYWDLWREEVKLADVVVANSKWSAKLLVLGGVPKNKIRIVPLAYGRSTEANPISPPKTAARCFPTRFTQQQPLELLFLGQAKVRKGIIELVQAMDGLRELPIRLSVVGTVASDVYHYVGSNQMVQWLGQRPRSEVAAFFQNAHVFILPTYSDGFGLTQLEALAEGTPVIASPFCGDVVRDGVEGRIVEDVTPKAIEAALRWAIANPATLAEMSLRCQTRLDAFTPTSVLDALQACY